MYKIFPYLHWYIDIWKPREGIIFIDPPGTSQPVKSVNMKNLLKHSPYLQNLYINNCGVEIYQAIQQYCPDIGMFRVNCSSNPQNRDQELEWLNDSLLKRTQYSQSFKLFFKKYSTTLRMFSLKPDYSIIHEIAKHLTWKYFIWNWLKGTIGNNALVMLASDLPYLENIWFYECKFDTTELRRMMTVFSKRSRFAPLYRIGLHCCGGISIRALAQGTGQLLLPCRVSILDGEMTVEDLQTINTSTSLSTLSISWVNGITTEDKAESILLPRNNNMEFDPGCNYESI
ncbi:hypothetical protein BDA99DRAFT_537246 [Phascolomyces articulosus]|uniref:Uncharacterized protein n=1 Tax=Phascolomyces articulosus TaxID=60185 RepID=A0AAD5K0D9_9FUNG|nr:hypothetical protein BDA99DRAFT_537246 [Phascolomyces articulosus]